MMPFMCSRSISVNKGRMSALKLVGVATKPPLGLRGVWIVIVQRALLRAVLHSDAQAADPNYCSWQCTYLIFVELLRASKRCRFAAQWNQISQKTCLRFRRQVKDWHIRRDPPYSSLTHGSVRVAI